ncbi:MAG TPA: FAD-dependent oxidoreductase, partial [Aggregatilineales bacterium]|nr:FAD-dependent oxidoreductase [Aggregatilineales bacterium]
VQRLYGQTPFIQIPNNHCKPCVGCAKNCYDFNPAVANMADQYDKDRHYAGYRKFFAGAFPGMVLAFYTVPSPPEISVPLMYELFALYMIVSLGLYFFFDTFVHISTAMITTLFGAIALNTYYLFNIPVFADTMQDLSGLNLPDSILLLGHAIILLLTLSWIFRTFQKEILFMAQAQARPSPLKSSVTLKSSLITHHSRVTGFAEVKFEQDGRRILAEPGISLLEVAEDNDLQIEAGCRMGICGADPVAILEGMTNLSPPTGDELSTLERLGFAENTRMACCARVHGAVKVSLKPERESLVAKVSTIESFHYDTSVERVVIIGNGIAGVTAADHIRRRHPICQIQIVAREHHHLYNRMGLSRLIYGRSAMQGLYLMPDSWYEDYQIECLLNTFAVQIDRENRYVVLADGGVLSYDRLVLATGSASYIPLITGYGMPGSFVLREAADA